MRFRYAVQRKYNHAHSDANGEFISEGGSGKTLESLGVHPTEHWASEFADNTHLRYEIFGERHGLSPDAYKATLDKQAQDAVKDTGLFVRVKPSALQKILDGGRFKSQFETNKSGGSVAKDSRDKLESGAFGFDEAKAGVENRPIYGYLSKDTHGDNTDADVSQYGNVAVELKPETRDRATMTYGDSLAMTSGGHYESVIPQPVTHPDSRIYPLYNGIDPLRPRDLANEYMEAQVHGGVSTSDIKSVTFHGKAPTAPIKKALNSAGIPFTVKL